MIEQLASEALADQTKSTVAREGRSPHHGAGSSNRDKNLHATSAIAKSGFA